MPSRHPAGGLSHSMRSLHGYNGYELHSMSTYLADSSVVGVHQDDFKVLVG